MRMKKLMILAVAAIALAACSRTFEKHETEGVAIGFGTWTEVLTKVRTQGDNNFTNGDDFAVYGFKTLAGPTNSVVFPTTTTTVVNTTDGTTWRYSPTRFWDQAASSYTFYAVSPAAIATAALTADANNINAETGAITSASIAFSGKNNDILVADKKVVTKTGSPAAFANSPVPLVFNHIASLVDFKVDKDTNLGNATLGITSFSITNIDSEGTFNVSTAYTDNHPVVTWTPTARAEYTNTSGVNEIDPLPTNVASTVGAEFVIKNLVVMPQSFRTDSNIQTVNIGYSITDEASNVSNYTASFNLKIFDWGDDRSQGNNTIISGWEPGKHYTFILTIDANKIDFSASINPWTATGNETGYNYIIQ